MVKRPGRPRESEEVPPEPGGRVRRHLGIEEEAAELLACAQDFLASVTPPAGVAGGQIEQLQGPLESALEPVSPAGFVGPDRALHLAAHVRELLHKLQLPPALCGLPVQDPGHGGIFPLVISSSRLAPGASRAAPMVRTGR